MAGKERLWQSVHFCVRIVYMQFKACEMRTVVREGKAVVKRMQQLFYMTNNRRDTKGESF